MCRNLQMQETILKNFLELKNLCFTSKDWVQLCFFFLRFIKSFKNILWELLFPLCLIYVAFIEGKMAIIRSIGVLLKEKWRVVGKHLENKDSSYWPSRTQENIGIKRYTCFFCVSIHAMQGPRRWCRGSKLWDQ